VALVVRTITLRAALLLTTYAVTVGASGPDRAGSLATHVVALTLWSFLAFVLDAIAIAAQAITGRSLGAGDVAGTRAVTRRMMWRGLFSVLIGGLALCGLRDIYVSWFTTYPEVRRTLAAVLIVAALWQP